MKKNLAGILCLSIALIALFGCSDNKLDENSLTITKNVIESVDDCYPEITPEYLEQRQEDISDNQFVDYSQFNEIETGMKLNKVLKIMETEPNETFEVINGIYDYVWYSSSDDNENYNIYISDDKVVYKKQTTIDANTTTEPSIDYSGITSSSGKTLEQLNEEISETEEKLNKLMEDYY